MQVVKVRTVSACEITLGHQTNYVRQFLLVKDMYAADEGVRHIQRLGSFEK